MHVFFFRGLSTYGHDNAQWSVFKFGPISKHLSKALTQRQIQFYPVLGMGAGPLVEVAERAIQFIVSHPAWLNQDTQIHLLGHSAGGLIGRIVLPRLEQLSPGKIKSLLTVASPHRGSALAQVCVDMPERYRGSSLFLKALGYDIKKKQPFFRELSKASVTSLFSFEETQKTAAKRASIVCSSPRQQWCTPLKLFYRVPAFRDFEILSDGVVEKETQAFGEVIAELEIDHFSQVGLFGDDQKFIQLCETIVDYFTRVELEKA